MKPPKPIKPKCPECGEELKIQYPPLEPNAFLYCVFCQSEFKIKAWWPVPGEKIK